MKNLGWPAMLALAVVGIVLAGLTGALIAGATNDDEDPDRLTTVISAADAAPSADDADDRTTGSNAPAAVVVDDDDLPLGKAEAQRVGKAAMKAAGGGTVVEIGRSDDPGEAYEVEVLTEQGEIDIALDQNLDRVKNLAYDD
jgi:hypothetical protein